MKTFEGKATVGPDGTLTMHLTEELAPGEHEVRLTVLAGGESEPPKLPLDLAMVEVDAWPAGLSLRREDMHDDWGR
ncbi:MAG: hypothetical protein HYU66_05900 [Armatimonadetes bacterium]|nr:hypothetical protein [Armatimonadota bacterium]